MKKNRIAWTLIGLLLYGGMYVTAAPQQPTKKPRYTSVAGTPFERPTTESESEPNRALSDKPVSESSAADTLTESPTVSMATSSAPTVTPERTAPSGADAGAFAVGDTIVIRRDSTRYMTGERISTWVYGIRHTIRQVDSMHHPGGLLIGGINSWLYPGSVERVGQPRTAAPIAPAEQEAEPTPVPPATMAESAVAQPAPVVEEPAAPAVVEEPQQKVEEPVIPAVAEEPQPEAPQQPAMSEEVTEPAADTPQPESIGADDATTTEEPKENVAAKDHGTHRFTIGVRGGYANNLSKAADAKHPFGYDAMLDLQYAHYWSKSADQCRLGVLTGVGIGYLQSGLQQSLNEQFTANTSDGDIRYTITADEVKDKAGQLQLEVPVMFSMITPGGFFLNAGPKVLLPVYTPSHQTITNPNVDAYFEEEGVHVVNEAVTGVVSESQQDLKATTANNLKVNILLGAELGYEFRLQSGYSIGLGAYANYGLWSAYRGTGDGSVFSLTAPDGAANATIDISTLTNAKATKMGYLDAGVKLTFNLDFVK